jgi:heme exporter protein B
MSIPAGAWKVFKKDLIHEMGSWETLVLMVAFSMVVLFLLRFSFDLPPSQMQRVMGGYFWLIVLMSSVMGATKTMEMERGSGALKGILLAPVPREAIFLGKLASLCVYLWIVEGILVLVMAVFFQVTVPPERMPSLLIPLALGGFGLATLGTFMSSLCHTASRSSILFALGYFPMSVPVLIASGALTQEVISGRSLVNVSWVKFLVVMDLVYLILCLLLFPYLVEE